ncbi:hypothetical protein EJD97_012113 [Solanum chilense]|uniref:Subtilisin-like protease fibronectin type-III domain-containing protein n=1 Tax=Solanum chilense TaxID=4083 RepID=A0A6N2BH77_SOLCI|nr:hypothetical protein EJD97_012113 [Solanum chilense]
MDLKFISTFLCFVLLHSSKTFGENFTNQSDLETYIVHLESPDQLFSNSKDLLLWHQSFLPTNSNHSSRILHSYRHVFNGFAAMLSSDEVREMEKKRGFLSARPQRIFQLHTTHTPSFLGLHQNVGLWNASNSDEVREMEKKRGFLSARPQRIFQLHTTHTPSFLGLHQNVGLWNASNSGKGVIIGLFDTGIDPQHPSFNDNGMPKPPLKWKGTYEFNVKTYCNKKLIGARNYVYPDRFPLDIDGHGTHTSSTAAGNFVDGANFFGNANGTAVGIAPRAHVAMAMEKGIFVSCSAGNSGPGSGTVENGAPWILTVGASTTDRKIRAVVVLGNGAEYEGESAYQPTNFSRKLLPLVNGKYCDLLHPVDVKGKIVLCDTNRESYREQIAKTVKSAGGAGAILMNNKEGGSTTLAVYDVFSMTQVTYKDGQEIINYMKSTPTPVANISYRGTEIGDKHAPTVAYFSSRGPCLQSKGILKPDIIGPGVNILAAWPTQIEDETTSTSTSTFNIISGTSMSCPHLAGDETLEPADILAVGAGHVNPSRANDPGLIYDIHPEDYIPYLCGLNCSEDQISMIVKKKVHCTTSISQSELNYPSFSIPKKTSAQTYTRTVTNVGEAISTYTVKVSGLKGVEVTVNPKILKFTELNQKASYNVSVKSLDLTGVGLSHIGSGRGWWSIYKCEGKPQPLS